MTTTNEGDDEPDPPGENDAEKRGVSRAPWTTWLLADPGVGAATRHSMTGRPTVGPPTLNLACGGTVGRALGQKAGMTPAGRGEEGEA